ncbi:MAG: M23 family metallopeptidase [Parvularculaceae bacterium]|nr:M23 family metallopeptidase [Parvularculaceae bacterium]
MARNRTRQNGNAAGWLLIIILIALIIGGYLWRQNGGSSPLPGDGAPPADETPADDGALDDDAPPTDDETPDDEPADEPEELTDIDGKVFSYLPVGDLLPSSGPGFVDETVYRENILFPTEDPVFLNSQVYRFGGGMGSVNGMEGSQCDARNYDYPWQDTFCEHRDRNQPLCPGGGHEGLDIRPHTCAKNVHWAVAVEDGRVIDIRRHWVTIQTPDGTIYNYLHLNMGELSVSEGQQVLRGDRIGKISNDFFKSDGTPVATTTHLHFEMYENYVESPGAEPLFTKVNPYMTLVAAYDRMLRGE